jgi:hypothetical protein
MEMFPYAADNAIGSRIEGSSFSGLLTRVEIGHIRIGSAGNTRSRSAGIGFIAQPTDVVAGREDQRHPVVDFSHQFQASALRGASTMPPSERLPMLPLGYAMKRSRGKS